MRPPFAVSFALLLGCSGSPNGAPAQPPSTPPVTPPMVPADREPPTTPARSTPAADARLQIQLEIDPTVTMDRVPMRRALLHFRNVGSEPVRVYLPNPDAFRLNISTLVFAPEAGPPLVVPDPHPHGYVVTEADFHLLAPGEERTFPQSFTLDPFVPGGGNQTARRAGFEPGRAVRVRWTYENQIRRWAGGRQTLDGPTRELFGGQDIPHIWTGTLTAELSWTSPP